MRETNESSQPDKSDAPPKMPAPSLDDMDEPIPPGFHDESRGEESPPNESSSDEAEESADHETSMRELFVVILLLLIFS